MDVISTIAMILEDVCACDFTVSLITESGFQCTANDDGTVAFLAKLHGTYHANSSELISLLEQWIASGASINVQNVHLTVDPMCDVQIDSFVDPRCKTKATSTWPVVVGSVAGILIMLVGVAVITLILFFTLRRCKIFTVGKDSK